MRNNLLSHRLFRQPYIRMLEDAMAALESLLILLETEAAG